MQVAFKINVKIARDRVKEAQKAQRRCEEMSYHHLAIGKNNQEATLTYHWGMIDDRLPYSWLATTKSAGSPLQSIFVASAERVKKFNSL